MNAIHRVGLTIAAVVALLVMAGAFVVQGYTNAQREAAQASAAQPTDTAAPTATATPELSLEPQTVYVAPVPTPAIIHVVKPAPAVVAPKPAHVQPPAPQPTPPVIHVVVPGPSGGDDGPGDN
jgi:hypothetical protein